MDTPAGSATVREVARVVTVTPIGSAALEPVTLAADVQIVNLIGGGGPDTFQVTPAVGTQFASDGNLDNLVVNVTGSATGASSALVIESAAGGTLANNQSVVLIKGPVPNSGTARTFTAGVQWPDINYTNIQTVVPNVAAAPPGQTGDSATESNTTVTITTLAPNGLQVGNSVTISGFTGGGLSYNGTWVITSILSPTMFTYTDTTSLPNTAGEAKSFFNPLGTAGPEINGLFVSGQTGVSAAELSTTPSGQTGVSATESGTTVTITTPSANGLQVGNNVTISGFTSARPLQRHVVDHERSDANDVYLHGHCYGLTQCDRGKRSPRPERADRHHHHTIGKRTATGEQRDDQRVHGCRRRLQRHVRDFERSDANDIYLHGHFRGPTQCDRRQRIPEFQPVRAQPAKLHAGTDAVCLQPDDQRRRSGRA